MEPRVQGKSNMCAKVHRHRTTRRSVLHYSNVRDKKEHMAKGLEENEGQAMKELEHHAERVEFTGPQKDH